MIYLKIEVIDDERFTVYYTLIMDDILEYDIEDINVFIQMLVLKIRKNYHLDLNGYYHLDVYIKKILILEFEQIDEYEDEVDLNITVHLNTPILVGFDDYFLIPEKKYYYQEKYYVPIEKIEYEKYVEFLEIVYNEEAREIMLKGTRV